MKYLLIMTGRGNNPLYAANEAEVKTKATELLLAYTGAVLVYELSQKITAELPLKVEDLKVEVTNG